MSEAGVRGNRPSVRTPVPDASPAAGPAVGPHGAGRRSRFRRIVGGVVAGLGLATAVASPVLADPPGPTDYRSEIVAVEPATPAIEVRIVGGDSFVELRVEPGTDAIVIGYEGEDYLWFRSDGVVFENQNSPATYLNTNRFGNDGVPANARADAEPDWKQVATGDSWAWHDHRAHWMQSARPVGLTAGDQILEAVIPLVVDDENVRVTVISTWQPEPSPVAMWLGAVAGLGTAAGAWFLRGRRLPPDVASIPIVLLAVAVGAAQHTSLPSATGPRLIWIALPLVAAVSAGVGVVLALNGKRFAADAALLFVGVELAVWGFVKRDGLAAAIVPTDAPFWLDRFATTSALVGGVGLAGIALWWLFAVPAAIAAPDEIAVPAANAVPDDAAPPADDADEANVGVGDPVSDSRERSGSPRPARP